MMVSRIHTGHTFISPPVINTVQQSECRTAISTSTTALLVVRSYKLTRKRDCFAGVQGKDATYLRVQPCRQPERQLKDSETRFISSIVTFASGSLLRPERSYLSSKVRQKHTADYWGS